MAVQGGPCSHLEAEILSSGGVLKPYSASHATSASSTAMHAEELTPLESIADQPHLAFLLGDEWLQGLQNEE